MRGCCLRVQYGHLGSRIPFLFPLTCNYTKSEVILQYNIVTSLKIFVNNSQIAYTKLSCILVHNMI